MKACRHCGRSKVNRPRGLCWTCYYTPGLKDLYPSTSMFARRGVDDFDGPALPPPLPTVAMPGTPDKVAVLCDRASKRLDLWHPNDAGAGTKRRVSIAG